MLKPLLCFFSALLVVVPFTSTGAEASTRSDVESNARQYIGVPYQYGGESPNGFDCSGFIMYVFNKVGIDLPRTTGSQYGTGKKVSKSDLRTGDLVFFNTSGSGVSHSGIYIGSGKFIHSSSSKGITITSLDSPYYWGPRYIGAKRVIKEKEKVETQTTPEPAPLPDGEYYDIPKDFWAYDEISSLSDSNIINGYPNDTFRPNQTVTRTQAAIMLALSFGLNGSDHPSSFKDVSDNHWALEAINAVEEAGIFKGDSDGNFRPNEAITRDQIAVIFKNAFNYHMPNATESFKDVPSDYWAQNAIAILAEKGITTGYSNGTFRPRHATTRAQFSVFLDKALN
jgi:hypothetical protein